MNRQADNFRSRQNTVNKNIFSAVRDAHGIFGSVIGENSTVNIGASSEHEPPASPEWAAVRVKRSFITAGLVRATAWLSGMGGLFAVIFGLVKVFTPQLQRTSQEGLLALPETSMTWPLVVAAGSIVIMFGLDVSTRMRHLKTRTFKLKNHPSQWAVAGISDEQGKTRRYRVKLDGTCPTPGCEGRLLFHNEVADSRPQYSPEGRYQREVVLKRKPFISCSRSEEHQWPFDVTQTHRVELPVPAN